MTEPARVTIKASGPDWTKSTVELDGKPLWAQKVTVVIDPNENIVQAIVVLGDFDLELSDLPERVFEAPFAPPEAV